MGNPLEDAKQSLAAALAEAWEAIAENQKARKELTAAIKDGLVAEILRKRREKHPE